MNGVLGMLELLIATELNPRQQEFADLIYRSSHSLLNILNSVLDLSKIEAGKLVLEPLGINLRRLMEETVSLMQPLAEKKKIEMVLKFPPSVPENVIVDGGRLRQVLVNLISNAVKFTEEGFISLEINAESMADNTAAYTFRVKDTGIGMTAEQQKIVFDKFSQADSSITRRFGGTGLGLTICQELIKLMGGEIKLESAPGLGTKIHFTLVLKLSENQVGQKPEFPENLKVFVAGPANPVTDTLGEILTAWNQSWSLIDRDHISETLQKESRPNTPTLAIIDLAPGEKPDEQQMADNIPNTAGTIYLMTPRQLTAISSAGRKLAESFLISKPVTSSKLASAMIEMLSRRKQRATDAFHSFKGASGRFKALTPDFSLKTLVVEDNEINQEVARGILEMFGCTVTVSGSGAEALEFLEQQSFDAVFLDCQMPEMDGFEVIRRIRAVEKMKTLPVIAMTAYSMPGDREKCLVAGMNDYLSKPINPDLLLQILRNIKTHATNINDPVQPIEISQSTDSDSEEPVFDAARIRRIFSRKPAALEKIVEVSHQNFQKILLAFEKHLAEKDFSGCKKSAHTMKGSTANLGGNLVSAIAQKLENACRDENSPLIEELKSELKLHYEDFHLALKHLSEELSQAGVPPKKP